MRILHINSARTFGGGERHTIDLANALNERGHEVYAAVGGDSAIACELKSLPAGNLLGLRLRNALDVRGALALAGYIKERKVEIVHAHVARDYPPAALAARRGGAQFILTRHLERPLSGLHKWTARRTSRVIAVSRAVEHALLDQKIFPPEKIRHIPNGIDIARFEDETAAPDREAFRQNPGQTARLLVGMTGELREHKGQLDLLRAAQLVTQDYAEVDFVIAGEDASPRKEYRAHLLRLVTELKLEDRVRFTGWVKDVRPLLHALDLFISPSRVEPFGLVMVEAMAAGLPVVATATGGAREIVEDGETGMIVPVGDVQAMAKAIGALVADRALRRRMSEAGRARARLRFSLERMVRETEAVYREVLSEA